MKQIPGQYEFVFKNDTYRIVRNNRKSRKRKPKQNKSHVRDPWKISKERYLELKDFCQKPENTNLVEQEARRVSEMLSAYIYLSVTENRSYEGVEYAGGQRIPFGRSDFYGYRRMFYHLLDEKLKQEGKENDEQRIHTESNQ